MRVLMIDDHVMVLQGLKNLLMVVAPTLAVDTADQISSAVEMAAAARYELVLLDWHLSDCDGGAAIERLRDAGCKARIVVLSGDTSVRLIRHVIDVGAAGFIPKKYSSETMLAALGVVLAGGIYLPPEALHDTPSGAETRLEVPMLHPEADRRFEGLTRRQVEVYRAATRGLPNKLIARELGIAESTVKSHLSVVYGVLGVANRTQAAYQASREGFRLD